MPTGADRARGLLRRRRRSRVGLPSAVAARGPRHRPPPDAPRMPPAGARPPTSPALRGRPSPVENSGLRRRRSAAESPGLFRRWSAVVGAWLPFRGSPYVSWRLPVRVPPAVSPTLRCGSPPAAWRWLSHLVPHPASPAAGSRPGFGPRRPGAPASGRAGRERGAPGPAVADCEPGACLSAVAGRGERARVDRRRCAARGLSVRRRRLPVEVPRAGHLGVRAWAPRTDRRHVRAPLVARPGLTRRRSSAGGRRLARGASVVARGRLPRGASSVACRGCLCRPLPVANRRLPCRLPRGRLSRCAPPPCEPPL